jgi:hypothetical protein
MLNSVLSPIDFVLGVQSVIDQLWSRIFHAPLPSFATTSM